MKTAPGNRVKACETKNQKDSPFTLSLDTILGISPMIGHLQECREEIRNAQDVGLLREIQQVTSRTLSDFRARKAFAVAPLDILVEKTENGPLFHIIELNGSGIGGLTNMSEDAVSATLNALVDTLSLGSTEPLVLIGSSGIESGASPRLNRLIYEKVLYVEAFRRRLRKLNTQPVITTADQYARNIERFSNMRRPVVVLGYLKELIAGLTQDADSFYFYGRPVTTMVNDRMCVNALSLQPKSFPFHRTSPVNASFLAGADKGVVYRLLNTFLQKSPQANAPSGVDFCLAEDRDALLNQVVKLVHSGKKCLIKPQGTGLGHGIEFFLDKDESVSSIAERIDSSINTVCAYYGLLPDGAFPYTVCDYINTAMIEREGHPLDNHKYEIRIVVYRDKMTLKAFPTIIKASATAFDSQSIERGMLINNITASATSTKQAGTNFMLPLCNWETLSLLGIEAEELVAACRMSTAFVEHVLQELVADPTAFMLHSRYFADA